jgi:hypothetical protein
MGSQPPRQQPIPPLRREQPEQPPDLGPNPQGISMETLTPLIGFAFFPVSLGAGFIAYAGARDARAIGGAMVLTLIAALAFWLVLRNRPGWRGDVRLSNERLAAILLGLIGVMILLGGLAGLSLGWSLGGAAVLVVAWLVLRASPSPR